MRKNKKNSSKAKNRSLITDVLVETSISDHKSHALNIIKTGQDEVSIVLFTEESEYVYVHYCQESDIGGYVVCNKDREKGQCALCSAGRQRKRKFLLPVYSLHSGEIEILSVSDSLRPHALLPQLANILASSKMIVTFITQENYKFKVDTYKLKKQYKKNVSRAIKQFLEKYNKGEIKLASIYQRLDNFTLASVEGIRESLDLKGIDFKLNNPGRAEDDEEEWDESEQDEEEEGEEDQDDEDEDDDEEDEED